MQISNLLKRFTMLALLVLASGASVCFSKDDEKKFDQTKYNIPYNGDWMSNLRDDAPIRLVSIPGAHDAASGTVNLAGTSAQNMNVNDLFNAGVRYFDFRVGFTAGIELRMYHGFVDLSRTFRGVMDDLYNKLAKHPTEFVIVEVTIESDTKQKGNANEHLQSYFRHTYDDKSVPKVWFTYWDDKDQFKFAHDKWMYFQPDLTVGDARGRMILLFNDVIGDEIHMQGPYIPSRGDGPGSICYIKGYQDKQGKVDGKLKFNTPIHAQNNCSDDAFQNHVEKKFNDYAKPEIDQFTAFVNQNPDSLIWCMNFLSAFIDKIPNQYAVAGPVNALFAQYVSQHPELYLGIVLMDYCACPIYRNLTSDVVNGDIALEAVINNNRRFWKEGTDRREAIDADSN